MWGSDHYRWWLIGIGIGIVVGNAHNDEIGHSDFTGFHHRDCRRRSVRLSIRVGRCWYARRRGWIPSCVSAG